MWYEGNYRRIFLDMHIADDDDRYLSNVDPVKLVGMLRDAGAQMIVVKCRTHTGLAHYPTKIGRQHRGLNGRDYVGEMIGECHKYGIAAKAYFSQIFDNYAYEHHPDWRMVTGKGFNSREMERYGATSMARSGRYGVLCPNNEEYHAYVHDCLTEIASNYQFETIFLDMPFWPEVCYCASCRKKYYEATGRELPRTVDWGDPAFREFQYLRERWMAEFAHLSTMAVKSVRPEVTIEHNMAVVSGSWRIGTSDQVGDECDYIGGDLYGGVLEQSFICKYYRNLTKALPFVYITSRCDPNLQYHTTTKTAEEFLLQAMVAMVHDGALSICDGANPDGTLCEEVYAGPVKEAFSVSRQYEGFVNGDLQSAATVWFPSHSKYDWKENGSPVCLEDDYAPYPSGYLKDKLSACDCLRTGNIPFDVIPSRKLGAIPNNLLIASNVVNIRDEEMRAIESFVLGGGSLYLSGHVGHPRLMELLEVEHLGQTEHDVTYMNPTEEGVVWFPGFTHRSPLALQGPQELIRPYGACQVLATLTLPYTLTGKREFAAIHSNPPGQDTGCPAVILKNVGKGRIFYAAAPIESCKPYMSRKAFISIIRSLAGPLPFESDAPGHVEVVGWVKDGRQYYAALNEQESAPFVPMDGVTITVPRVLRSARVALSSEPLEFSVQNGRSIIRLPRIEVFQVIEVE